MTSPLLLLAEKVEGLEGPDREMDAEIVTTLCPDATVSEYIRGEGDDIVFHAQALGIRDKDCCPWYTASLDSALTLVPEGCVLHALGQSQSPSDEKRPWLAMVVQCGQSLSTGRTSYSATPALAICDAALRARAAMEAGDE